MGADKVQTTTQTTQTIYMGPNHEHQLDSVTSQGTTIATQSTPEQTPTIAHKLPKPLPIPSVAYGLTITNDVAFVAGCHYVPKSIDRSSHRSYIERIGRKFLDAYCQYRFPDIPLPSWRPSVVAVLPRSEVPLIMLGRRGRCAKTGERVDQISVNEEQVQVLRDALSLGKQNPGWYRVAIYE